MPLIMLIALSVIYILFRDDAIPESINHSSQSYMENVTIIHKKENQMQWTGNIKRVLFSGSEKSAKLDGIVLHFPEKNISLRAKSGIYGLEKNMISLEEEVIASNQDYEIKSENLKWDVGEEKMTSESEVIIKARNFTIKADSMNASREGKVSLSGNVKAFFQ